jgi:hypothetical protein
MSYLEIYFTGSSRNGFCSLKQKLNKNMDSRRERGLGTFYESPTAFTNPSLCFFYYEESSFTWDSPFKPIIPLASEISQL